MRCSKATGTESFWASSNRRRSSVWESCSLARTTRYSVPASEAVMARLLARISSNSLLMSRCAESATPMLFSSWRSWLLRARAASSCWITRREFSPSRARSRRRRSRSAVTGRTITSSRYGCRRTSSSASARPATPTIKLRRPSADLTQSATAARSASRWEASARTRMEPLPCSSAFSSERVATSSVLMPGGSSPATISRVLPQTRMLDMAGRRSG
ncbi:MAG: hypothetical protein DMF81_09215 [Acidobacteria bacterium]|nr:MAG: hypothetical protein DMF81_09215 [Acidobacteriota bacterium]